MKRIILYAVIMSMICCFNACNEENVPQDDPVESSVKFDNKFAP